MTHPLLRPALLLIGSVALTLIAARGAPATPSAAAIAQDLRSLGEMGTVLHIGAHPDDENTDLITYFSRGRGYRTAYLSLTRGDGGQNELGSDFDEKLGVIRTQELLAARQQDHGRQFFTRAVDFGFSKSPEETLRIWNREQVLGDVVRVIRQFRPDVIITRFPIPPGSGGHGHHTASAMLAVEAFKLASDPQAYPEQLTEGLTPWQAKRVVWNEFGQGRGANGLNGPSVKLDIGGNDPVTGEPFGTIANRSRGMHKTQGLGGFSGRNGGGGPNVQNFMLLAGEPATSDLMDGVDVTWGRVNSGAKIGTQVAAVAAQFKPEDPAATIPALLDLRQKLAALPADPLVTDKRAQLDRILQACLGLHTETTIDSAEVVPGESFKLHSTVEVQAKNIPIRQVEIRGYGLDNVKPSSSMSADLTAGTPLQGDFTAVLAPQTPFTQPYWLREDWAAGTYRVDDPKLIGRPENPPPVTIDHVLSIGGQILMVSDTPVQITTDARGEHRRRLDVIPPVSMLFESEISLFAPGGTKNVTVDLLAARANMAGSLQVTAPAGWKVTPASSQFKLAAVGEKARLTFSVTAPAEPGSGRLVAVTEIGGQHYSNQRQEIRYDHLPLLLLQPRARTRVAAFDLAIRGHAVGYLPGAGDKVAEAIEQMGYTVRILNGADLTPEKLHDLDAVVIGVRAFNERPDLAFNLPGLFAYVEAGGTVIAQYNRPNGLKTETLAPYALSIQGPAPQLRVTDEKSPFMVLDSDSTALISPNQITAADFENWIQERGTYYASSWDEKHFQAILAMNDPGEPPLKSGILIAHHGRGYYVYTSLAFFRQLPAGVPGAYRLFANLLSLGKNPNQVSPSTSH